MIKNKITQVVFQTIYCVLAIFGIIGSLGYFVVEFNDDFYLMYTNLSNYICISFMFVSLVYTIKQANKKEDGPVTLAPTFKFMCVIMILVTFLVYNFLLAQANGVRHYFTSVPNLTMHLILPVMFILDWVLFYEHGKVKWYYPLLSLIMPLIYVAFILIRAGIVHLAHMSVKVLYPYFFLDLGTLGVGGFLGWLFALIAVFVALGYIIYALDNIKRWRNKKQKTN